MSPMMCSAIARTWRSLWPEQMTTYSVYPTRRPTSRTTRFSALWRRRTSRTFSNRALDSVIDLLLFADLTVPVHDELLGRQLRQSHRAERVHLGRRDPDLRTEPELVPIVEARRGVHEHAARAHLVQEPLRIAVVPRDDRLGVVGAVVRNVIDGALERIDHPYGQDQIQVFRGPILFGRGLRPGHDRPGALATSQLDAGFLELFCRPREEFAGDPLVNEQRLQGVEDAGP